MGFLSNPLSQYQSQIVQQNFQLGLQLGAERQRQNLAAQNALQLETIRQQQESAREQQLRTMYNQERMDEAKMRAETLRQQTAAQFTEHQQQYGTLGLQRQASSLERGVANILNHPEYYTSGTLQQATQYLGQIQNVTSKALLGIANTQPGQNIPNYEAMFNSLTPPKIELSQDYLDNLSSKTAKNYMTGTGKTKNADGADTPLSNWRDNFIGYQQSRADYLNKLHSSDPQTQEIYKNEVLMGHDPYAPEAKNMETYQTAARQWGAAARDYVLSGKADPPGQNDLQLLTKSLLNKGIDPFDPDQSSQVGQSLYNLSQNPKVSKDDLEKINNASYLFTNKPADFYAPTPQAQPTQYGTSSLGETGAGIGAAGVPPKFSIGINIPQFQ